MRSSEELWNRLGILQGDEGPLAEEWPDRRVRALSRLVAEERESAVKELAAENQQAMNLASEALGTDPEHRTLLGCVGALATWAKGKQP